MNRRHLPTLVAWLLPLLCLRALLPAGFMPATTDAGLQLVLCSGGFYKTLPASSLSGDAQSGAPTVSVDSPCIFALAAATTGPAPVVNAIVDFVPLAASSIPPFQFDHSLSRPLLRAQQSRGPPALA